MARNQWSRTDQLAEEEKDPRDLAAKGKNEMKL